MTSLDARALTTDREGLAILGAVLGTGGELPSLEARFGVPASLSYSVPRRRDPLPPSPTRTKGRAVRAVV